MAVELKNKRSYTAKHFDNGDGTFTMNAHVGHIHYFNKLGVGDSINDFREIDETLVWNDKKRGWEFKFHSFNPFLPEYADGWVAFRDLFDGKDQTIRYKAVCSHIKGRLVSTHDIGLVNEGQLNCVIYDNAFGMGFDYILYFSRSSLKKVVRIRDGFKGTSDLDFKFQVEFPVGKDIFRSMDKESLQKGYKLLLSGDKDLDTIKQTLIGNNLGDGKEWFTYLRSFKVWDSAEIPKTEPINVKLSIESRKVYLTKHIPASFLISSVGDVFTDTTTSYYSGSGDGACYEQADTWSDVLAGNADAVDDTSSSLSYIYAISDHYGSGADGARWYHGFYPIDTSEITTSNTVTGAKMYLYVGADLAQFVDTWAIVQTQQQATNDLVVSDHARWTKSAKSNAVATGSLTNNAMNYWTLSDLDVVIRDGWTKLGIASGNAISETDPQNTGKQCAFQSYQSEASSNDPYLSVTYEPAATGVTVTPDALALTSVINDVTISTVRNITTILSVQSLTSSVPTPTINTTINTTVTLNELTLTSSQPNCTVYPLAETTTASSVIFMANRDRIAIKLNDSGTVYLELD